MTTSEIGKTGETLASKYLKKQGYRVIGRNIHMSHNEIDIVAKNKTFIVFVEVKTRSTDENMDMPFGTPASAVNRDKQRRTVEAAREYLRKNNHKSLQPRFDVIEIFLHKDTHKLIRINHIENAFGA